MKTQIANNLKTNVLDALMKNIIYRRIYPKIKYLSDECP